MAKRKRRTRVSTLTSDTRALTEKLWPGGTPMSKIREGKKM